MRFLSFITRETLKYFSRLGEKLTVLRELTSATRFSFCFIVECVYLCFFFFFLLMEDCGDFKGHFIREIWVFEGIMIV